MPQAFYLQFLKPKQVEDVLIVYTTKSGVDTTSLCDVCNRVALGEGLDALVRDKVKGNAFGRDAALAQLDRLPSRIDVEVGKARVARAHAVVARYNSSLTIGEEQFVDLPAANNPRLVLSGNHREGLLGAVNNLDPFWREGRITRENDVSTVLEGLAPRKALKRAPSHDDGVPGCAGNKMPHILAVLDHHPTVKPDSPVVTHSNDRTQLTAHFIPFCEGWPGAYLRRSDSLPQRARQELAAEVSAGPRARET